MLGLAFCSKLDWGSYIISIAKTVSQKIGDLIRSMRFLSPEVALISIDLPYGHAWNTVVMSSLVILVATRNCWISYKNRYAGQLVLHFLPLLKPSLIIKMKLAEIFSYRYYFGICLSELAELVPLPYSQGRYTTYCSGRLHDFSVTIPRGYKDVYVNSFFPLTA